MAPTMKERSGQELSSHTVIHAHRPLAFQLQNRVTRKYFISLTFLLLFFFHLFLPPSFDDPNSQASPASIVPASTMSISYCQTFDESLVYLELLIKDRVHVLGLRVFCRELREPLQELTEASLKQIGAYPRVTAQVVIQRLLRWYGSRGKFPYGRQLRSACSDLCRQE